MTQRGGRGQVMRGIGASNRLTLFYPNHGIVLQRGVAIIDSNLLRRSTNCFTDTVFGIAATASLWTPPTYDSRRYFSRLVNDS